MPLSRISFPFTKLITWTNYLFCFIFSFFTQLLCFGCGCVGAAYMCGLLIEETKQESTTDDDDDIVMGSQISILATKQEPTPRKGKQLENYNNKLPKFNQPVLTLIVPNE